MKKIISTGIILLGLLMVVQACRVEKRLGKMVMRDPDSIAICIIDPVGLLKDNLKTYEIEKYDSLPAGIRDSLLYFNSRFLQYVDDSLFLGLYTSNLREHLKSYGIKVYAEDSMNAFLAAGGKAYLFTLAQATLEEYLEPYTKSLSFDTNDYQWQVWQNAIGLNVWYEARALNRTDSKMDVLYGNMFVRDKVKGQFQGSPFTGDIEFVYTVDTITMNSVYSLASKAATRHSQYIFDYIINDQIAQKQKPGGKPAEYMHYDMTKKKLVKAGTHRFTVMDDKK